MACTFRSVNVALVLSGMGVLLKSQCRLSGGVPVMVQLSTTVWQRRLVEDCGAAATAGG